MSYCKIQASSTVTVGQFDALLPVWESFGRDAQTLIGAVIVEEPLTRAQLRTLPKDLRRKIQAPDDSVTFLDRLWNLDDTRA